MNGLWSKASKTKKEKAIKQTEPHARRLEADIDTAKSFVQDIDDVFATFSGLKARSSDKVVPLEPTPSAPLEEAAELAEGKEELVAAPAEAHEPIAEMVAAA
jgi:hypothetical protein